MSVETVDVDGVMVTTVDDGKVNALSLVIMGGMRSAIAAATEQGCPLIISGREGCFSAGFDLSVVNSGDQDSIVALFAEGAEIGPPNDRALSSRGNVILSCEAITPRWRESRMSNTVRYPLTGNEEQTCGRDPRHRRAQLAGAGSGSLVGFCSPPGRESRAALPGRRH
jgi:hypothetical protein